MKHKRNLSVLPTHSEPSEAAIRECAYALYEESGCVPDRDLENWLAASTSLRSHAAERSEAPFKSVTTPKFGEPEPGHVHAATGHGRTVRESTAHFSGVRNA